MSESVHAGPRQSGEAAAHPVAAAFRKHLSSVCGAMLFAGFSIYLLLPLYQAPKATAAAESEKESYNLDCFLVRDASGSVDPEHYQILEEKILGPPSAGGTVRVESASLVGEGGKHLDRINLDALPWPL